MVYCGKPSKGCGACRARKVKTWNAPRAPRLTGRFVISKEDAGCIWMIYRSVFSCCLAPSPLSSVHFQELTGYGDQCDQGTPSCQRCIKAHRECPGYRDQLSLLFRDQSSSVARKAKSNTTSVPSPSAVTTVTATTSPTPGSWRNHANTPTDYELTQTSVRSSPSAKSFRSGNYGSYDQHIDSDDFSLVPVLIDRRQQAICYCLKSFVWLNGSLIKGLDYNADISPTAPMAQKAMMKGILAVGMANLSRTGARSQSMKIEAQQEYYKALKFTNAAISHPTQATDDATLTAILCMSLFEILTSRRPERLDSFIQHTNGAVALLELRGRLRVIEPQSLHLFEFMRSEILYNEMAPRSPDAAHCIRKSGHATKHGLLIQGIT
uniref:Uncharacterized protein n=1 Tax=Talaromyces marneffei PM1 TaxID=1077442 RepID=A0A093UPQ2_TALMA